MLSLDRRRVTACPHTSMRYKPCRCLIWVVGSLDGKPLRTSINLTNWEVDGSLALRQDLSDLLRAFRQLREVVAQSANIKARDSSPADFHAWL